MNAITEKKARLLDLTTGVLELVRDGKRDIDQVSEVFQIIKDNPGFIKKLSKKFLETIIKVKQSEFFNLLSGNESLVIDSVDGTEILESASDLFVYIDPDFRNYKADEKGQPTEEMPVQVHELVKDATFSQMFGSLSNDLDKLCFTQAQIKNFVKKHRNWLRTDGYATFFLFKSHNHFFVAYVRLYADGGLEVNVRRFEDFVVWGAELRPRVVFPQLA